MVIGALKAIAKEFYHLVIDMEMVNAEEEEEGTLKYHYMILIDMVAGKRNQRNLGSKWHMCVYNASACMHVHLLAVA